MAAITTAVVAAGATVYSANKQSRASKDAARAQTEASEKAIASNEAALEQSRADLNPFKEAGEQALTTYQDRLTNPTTKADIVNNDLYQALFSNSNNAISSNQAARGKLGSGDTLADLTNSSLSIGSNIYNQETDRLYNLAALGSNAAAGQATSTMQNAANNSQLQTGIGNAQAAGIVGSANATTDGVNNLVGIGSFAMQNYSNSQRQNTAQQNPLPASQSSANQYYRPNR